MTSRIPLQVGPAQCSFPQDGGWGSSEEKQNKQKFYEVIFFIVFMGAVHMYSFLRRLYRGISKHAGFRD